MCSAYSRLEPQPGPATGTLRHFTLKLFNILVLKKHISLQITKNDKKLFYNLNKYDSPLIHILFLVLPG
jgi:hypothetical protein